MAKEIFRQKSLDKIKSPEELNDYVRVANPGVWLILFAAVALLVGACVFGTFGRIKTTVGARITVSNGQIECTVTDPGDFAKIKPGMGVETENAKGTVKSVDPATGAVGIEISLSDGVYQGKIVIESIAPLSFAFN